MNIDDKELERDIENAFRARGLKEAMRQWDIDAKGERRGGDATAGGAVYGHYGSEDGRGCRQADLPYT